MTPAHQADVLTKLRRLMNDPGATEGEREAARLALERKSVRLGLAETPRRLVGRPSTIAEHGTHARAQICTDACAQCGPVRQRVRERQRAYNRTAREAARGRTRGVA